MQHVWCQRVGVWRVQASDLMPSKHILLTDCLSALASVILQLLSEKKLHFKVNFQFYRLHTRLFGLLPRSAGSQHFFGMWPFKSNQYLLSCQTGVWFFLFEYFLEAWRGQIFQFLQNRKLWFDKREESNIICVANASFFVLFPVFLIISELSVGSHYVVFLS